MSITRTEMLSLTPALLGDVMPRARDRVSWCDALNAAMEEFDIHTPRRAAAFLAQIAHESGELLRLEENLNYSAARLRKIWPGRFPSDALALAYARQPERLANFVYAGRLGNGPTASGDGWRFRGRGVLQVTGRTNYRDVGRALALQLEDEPERLERFEAAARSAAHFWRSRGLNALADFSGRDFGEDADFVEITKRINGRTVGLADRRKYWATAKRALGVA